MARQKRYTQAGALNISANPHPDGVYIAALQNASRFLVRVRGSDFAKITEPTLNGGGLHTGRILVWTEIDVNGAWLDLTNEDELPVSVKNMINIPENAKPNYRTFNYVFDNNEHRLYFESSTELHANLGPSSAKRIFSILLSREIQGPDSPEVEVTVVPDEKALTAVLGLPGLRSLLIRVVIPNPDTAATEAKRRVYSRMDAMHARLEERHYIKASGAPRLEPTPEVQEEAEVAAENGFVRGEGRAADGTKLEAATDRRPKRYQIRMDQGDTFLARLLATISLGR